MDATGATPFPPGDGPTPYAALPPDGSDTPSEADYDHDVRPALASGGVQVRVQAEVVQAQADAQPGAEQPQPRRRRPGRAATSPPSSSAPAPDLRSSDAPAAAAHKPKPPRRRFTSLVYTQQLTTFDPQNLAAANSPFHGFYVLFWVAVGLLIFKISANNWRRHGSPLGSSEIMKAMFNRDAVVLLVSDGVMCGLTGVSWLIQRLVLRRYLDWDSGGWIVQNLWQTAFCAGVVGWTLVRDWPWTHTVFFVLHGLVMLMKQHSYAFYNGYLSTLYQRRRFLLAQLDRLATTAPAGGPGLGPGLGPGPDAPPPAAALDTPHLDTPPTAAAAHRRHLLTRRPAAEPDVVDRIARAVAARQPLDADQIRLYARLLRWDADALADELRGTAPAADAAAAAYPHNLTLAAHYRWLPLPTVVYELAYPRTDAIRWAYVAEKTVAMVGIIFVMVQVSQYAIYPIVMRTVEMKESGMPLAARFKEFPWMLSDLIFPFMMEYLLVWYLVWETILNILAELTCFADRSFYGPWWNSVSWDQFSRNWNRPVYTFLLRHIYHSSISCMRVNKHTATLITFFFSACVHELVMWCLFKKLRGYLLVFQMCQLPLVKLSQTRWLKGRKTLCNFMFWMGIFISPSLLCSLYLLL